MKIEFYIANNYSVIGEVGEEHVCDISEEELYDIINDAEENLRAVLLTFRFTGSVKHNEPMFRCTEDYYLNGALIELPHGFKLMALVKPTNGVIVGRMETGMMYLFQYVEEYKEWEAYNHEYRGMVCLNQMHSWKEVC